jgi:ABC-2 type transport system ATP-binding protein
MIEAVALTKTYGAVSAVTDLTFTVRPGIVTGFLGPNGAGKTTTMRMAVGLATPTSGRVTVDGQRYAELKHPMRTVGALLDARAVHPGRTARDHLVFLAQSNGIPRTRVDEVLETVGLASAARRRAGQLSLGMGQRLGIAAALLGDPGVLIFDEPVNGLDPEGIRWIRELMRGLAAEGRTVLVSSHLMSEMALTADHLLIIGRGRLIADVGMQEFIDTRSEHTVLVRTERAGAFGDRLKQAGAAVEGDGDRLTVRGLDSAEIGRLAAADGVPLVELTPRRTSLEDAFMELTRDSAQFTARREEEQAWS